MTLGLDVQIETDLVTEPVDVVEAKAYLNVDYDTWDSLIETLISSARTKLERYTGCSFGEKALVATFMNTAKEIEIPYGPILEVTAVKSIDADGVKTTLTEGQDYILVGNLFKTIRFNSTGYPVEVEYTAGYNPLPADLKIAILKQVGMDFQYRENVVETATLTELSNGAKQNASSYRRITLF